MERIAIAGRESQIGNYLKAIEAVGAKAIHLKQGYDVDDYDGLLLPGGADIDPALYHQEMAGSYPGDPELDRWQLKVLDDFVRKEKPILGICRGHQLINVYFGGTLIQDIRSDIVHIQTDDGDSLHLIEAERGSFLHGLYGESFIVNSSHHQSSDVLGKDLKAIARSADGIVEAAIHLHLPIISVQFHPERMSEGKTVDGLEIIRYFQKMADRPNS